jgi:hypothetical protein
VTFPLTPAEGGLANQAIVSATSIGSPPCWRLFILRPASRVAIGIAAVICVSMKPGATALIVHRRSASGKEYASTIPMIPAFEVEELV